VPSDDKPKFTGIVEQARGNGFFSVAVDMENGNFIDILCQLSGKMRTHNIKVVEGDKVDVELDPYDMQKGRIIYRKR
jgi:translation initiation factor IF-1